MKRELPRIELCYAWKEDMIISSVYKSGYYKIVGTPYLRRDRLWIKGRYKDLKILCWKDERNYLYCYVLLKKLNGKGKIVELISKSVIVEDLNIDSFKNCLMKCLDYCKHIEVPVISYLDKKEKTYTQYTPSKGVIFGPYHYNEVEEFRYGVILDQRYAVCDHAYHCDLSEYSCLGSVYKDKESDDYIIFVDEDKALFRHMGQDKNDESMLSVETKTHIYKYNKVTGETMQYKIGDPKPLSFLQSKLINGYFHGTI